MIGNLLWNLTFAVIGFIFSFSLAIQTNTIDTSMIRAAVVFIVLYSLTFFFRWLGYLAVVSNSQESSTEEHLPSVEREDGSKEGDTDQAQVARQASEAIRTMLKDA